MLKFIPPQISVYNTPQYKTKQDQEKASSQTEFLKLKSITVS